MTSIFVGDDTGLLKKFNLSLSIEDLIISEQVIRKKRYNKDLMENPEKLPEEWKEEAVVRKHADVTFKLAGKSGT